MQANFSKVDTNKPEEFLKKLVQPAIS
jgi:hypothetical protein